MAERNLSEAEMARLDQYRNGNGGTPFEVDAADIGKQQEAQKTAAAATAAQTALEKSIQEQHGIQDPAPPAPAPAKAEEKPAEQPKPVETPAPKAAEAPTMTLKDVLGDKTTAYVADAKKAVAELKEVLGDAKFAELEERLSKGLKSPNFIMNAKGGYEAKANVFDIALKAQGFTGVASPEERAAAAAKARDNGSIPPSPVVTDAGAKPKTQAEWMNDLKNGNAADRKNAMYHLVGVDDTIKDLQVMMKR